MSSSSWAPFKSLALHTCILAVVVAILILDVTEQPKVNLILSHDWNMNSTHSIIVLNSTYPPTNTSVSVTTCDYINGTVTCVPGYFEYNIETIRHLVAKRFLLSSLVVWYFMYVFCTASSMYASYSRRVAYDKVRASEKSANQVPEIVVSPDGHGHGSVDDEDDDLDLDHFDDPKPKPAIELSKHKKSPFSVTSQDDEAEDDVISEPETSGNRYPGTPTVIIQDPGYIARLVNMQTTVQAQARNIGIPRASSSSSTTTPRPN